MPRLAEPDIIARIASKLTQLGCPDVRAAEGTAEWKRIRGAYTQTPDMVAGPIVGSGAPEDFFVDVFSPKGEQYVNPRAGAPGAAASFAKMLEAKGSFTVADLGREYGPFYGPMNKKIAKYSTTRSGSPMLGLAMYFCIAGDSFVGPLLAHMHSFAAMDDAFGLTSGRDAELVKDTLNTMFGPGDSVGIVVHDLKVQLAFVMIHADKFAVEERSEKTLLIINAGVVHEEFAWKQHPVVQWLRALAFGPLLSGRRVPR